MKKTILIFAALAGAMLWTGCQRFEEEPVGEKPEEAVTSGDKLFLCLEASKTVDTRALELDGSTLNAYWKDGEQVAVYLEGTYLGLLTADAHDSDRTRATLSGELDSVTGITGGTTLTLLFPRKDWDYTGQDGSAPDESGTLATRYDYALATVTVDTIEGSTITTGDASFENAQSMYRFGFKEGGAGSQIPVKGFTVYSSHQTLTRTRSWSGGAWTDTPGSIVVNIAGNGTATLSYAALRNTLAGTPTQSQIDARETIDTYSFDVIAFDDALYLGEKGIPAQVMDAQGRFISAQSVSVTKSDLARSGTVSEVW